MRPRARPRPYLLPDGCANGKPIGTPEGLLALVRVLMDAHVHMQRRTATLLPTARLTLWQPLYQQALATTQTTPFATPWGMGIAECLLACLKNICHLVLTTCRLQLLPAAHLDNLAQFRLGLGSLRLACCTADPQPGNLLLPAQTLIPLLAKLSSQIDNRVTSLQACEAKATSAPLHAAKLASTQALNRQVHQVLTTAQSIVNLLSNWQDALGELADMSPSVPGSHFYEDQVQTGIAYWQALEALLQTTPVPTLIDVYEQHKPQSQRVPIQPRKPSRRAAASA